MAGNTVQRLLAEFVGTFFLVFIISMSYGDYAFITIGFGLMVLVYSYGHVSGAMFNPAVTLGVYMRGGFESYDLKIPVLYVVSQVLGGMGGGLAAVAIDNESVNIPPKPINDTHETVVVAGCEIMFTCLLVLAVVNTAVLKVKQPNAYSGIAIGLSVLSGAAAVGSISGGVFNPAVGSGLLLAGNIKGVDVQGGDLIVYWLAPLVGATLAAVVSWFMNRHLETVADEGHLEHMVDLEDEGEPYGLLRIARPPALTSICVTELVGTFFLTAVAALSGQPFAVGSALLVLVYMGDHVSGAEYNPAVTLAVALRFRIPSKDFPAVLAKMVSQLVGGILGAYSALGLAGSVKYPNSMPEGGSHTFGTLSVFSFETIMTIALVLAYLTATTPTTDPFMDDRSPGAREASGQDLGVSSQVYGVVIGFAAGVGSFCGGTLGNTHSGVLNPAMGTGIFLADGNTQDASIMWVYTYWFAPLLASFLGAGLFTLLHNTRARAGVDPSRSSRYIS